MLISNGSNNVYMEITNSVHGGEGWDFSEVLWSPVSSSWKIMGEVKAGDIIIHSLKKHPHAIVGASVVRKKAQIIDEEPLKPGKWADYEQYYRIELQNYSRFPKELKQVDFFTKYEKKLLALGDQKSFYSLSEDKSRVVGTAQKYLAKIPNDVQELLMDWFNSEGITDLFSNVEITDSTDDDSISTMGNKSPETVKTTVSRTIRDTKMISEMKSKYNNTCQICGRQIKLPNGKLYSEGHHLKKLGGEHKGPDIASNVIILCPNHHTEFDYGAIAIDPQNMTVIHVDSSNEYAGKKLAYQRNDLDMDFIKYHFKHIFNK